MARKVRGEVDWEEHETGSVVRIWDEEVRSECCQNVAVEARKKTSKTVNSKNYRKDAPIR